MVTRMVSGYDPRVLVDYPTLLIKTGKGVFFFVLYPFTFRTLPVLLKKTVSNANKERVPYPP